MIRPARSAAALTRRGPPTAFVVATLVGSVLALAGFALVLSAGSAAVLVSDQYGNFYDAQARALLAGHLDVPARALYFEGFRIHGKTYTYFGLWPAVLRMPVLQLFPGAAGRLTRLSMLGAFTVFLTGVGMLHWRIRTLLAGTVVSVGRGRLRGRGPDRRRLRHGRGVPRQPRLGVPRGDPLGHRVVDRRVRAPDHVHVPAERDAPARGRGGHRGCARVAGLARLRRRRRAVARGPRDRGTADARHRPPVATPSRCVRAR